MGLFQSRSDDEEEQEEQQELEQEQNGGEAEQAEAEVESWVRMTTTLRNIVRAHMREEKVPKSNKATEQADILRGALETYLEDGPATVHTTPLTEQPYLKVPVPLHAWQSSVVDIFAEQGIHISEAPLVELPIVGNRQRTGFYMMVFLKNYIDELP
jgi:cytochrome c1